MFIIQIFEKNKWIDVGKRKDFDKARGDAWALSIKGKTDYGDLTRVIVRTEIALSRYGQKESK